MEMCLTGAVKGKQVDTIERAALRDVVEETRAIV
jgi:hypothetical protein